LENLYSSFIAKGQLFVLQAFVVVVVVVLPQYCETQIAFLACLFVLRTPITGQQD
jgi:hypothetical protein